MRFFPPAGTENIIDAFGMAGPRFKIDRDHSYHLCPAGISYTIYD